jgi:hypothetical protein
MSSILKENNVFSSFMTKSSTDSMPMDISAGAGRSPTIEQSLLLKPEIIVDDGDPWVDTGWTLSESVVAYITRFQVVERCSTGLSRGFLCRDEFDGNANLISSSK